MTDSGKVIFFFAFVVGLASSACRHDFTEVEQACYRLFFEPYGFIEALEICNDYGGYLADFSDDSKYVPFFEFLESNAAEEGYYWMGGTDAFIRNDWRWIKTGIKFETIPSLIDWCAGHPHIDSSGNNLTVLLFSPTYDGNFCWMDADPKIKTYMGNEIGFICEDTPSTTNSFNQHHKL